MSSSVAIFDKVGIVSARSGDAGASVLGIEGLDSRATFGLLQSFIVDSKVLAQIKRTLRQAPVIFPMGDELSEISLSFIAPVQTPCANPGLKSDLAAAIEAYESKRVKPDAVTALIVRVASNVRYSCLLLGMRSTGSMQGATQLISIDMHLVGVKI